MESDAGTRLLFKIRSGNHGLHEELHVGRHRGRDGSRKSTLCGDEWESVTHPLWERPVYASIRNLIFNIRECMLFRGYRWIEKHLNTEDTYVPRKA